MTDPKQVAERLNAIADGIDPDEPETHTRLDTAAAFLREAADLLADPERGRLEEPTRGAIQHSIGHIRALADRLHDASDTERACATGAGFARGIADDIEAALQTKDPR